MAVDEARGKQGLYGFRLHVLQWVWWQGHDAARVFDPRCVSRRALRKTGPSSVPQPSAALSVNQDFAYFPVRFCLGHWSLLCTRCLSPCLKNSLPALRCECLRVTRWVKRTQIAAASTLSQTYSLKHTTKETVDGIASRHPRLRSLQKTFFSNFPPYCSPWKQHSSDWVSEVAQSCPTLCHPWTVEQFKCLLRGQQIAWIWLWLCLLFIVWYKQII